MPGPGRSLQGRLKRLDMFERHADTTESKAASGKGVAPPCAHIASRIRLGRERPGSATRWGRPLPRRPEPGDAPGDLALPAPDVKDRAGPPQVMHD